MLLRCPRSGCAPPTISYSFVWKISVLCPTSPFQNPPSLTYVLFLKKSLTHLFPPCSQAWATRRLHLGLRAGAAAVGTCLLLPFLSMALGAVPSAVWLAVSARASDPAQHSAPRAATFPATCVHYQCSFLTNNLCMYFAAQAEALFYLKQRRKWAALSLLKPCALQAHQAGCRLESQARAWAAHTEVAPRMGEMLCALSLA